MLIECSFPEVRDGFYRQLSSLLGNVHSTDLVVVAGDFKAHFGNLAEMKRNIRDRFFVTTDRISNGDCLIHVCFDRRWFLANTNFVIKSDMGSSGIPFAFTALDSDLPHCHRIPVVNINRESPNMLVYTYGLRPSFCLSSLSFVLSLWSYQHKCH